MRRLTLLSLAAVLTAWSLAAEAHALKFKPCGGGFECSTIKVPLDYDEPDGRTTALDVAVLPAKDQKRRIGPLYINYGGPGGDAVSTTQAIGKQLFAAYRERFDLVALDPRGTGDRPLALDCKADQLRIGVYNQPFAQGDPAEEIKLARTYADRCEKLNGEIAPHVSTANVARDMDELRVALGEKKINYFGFSYGTALGATYARLFPQHARAVVLDGPLDEAYFTDPSTHLERQTIGFEKSLDHYFKACKREREFCEWTKGRKPEAAYDRLIARADKKAIPARSGKITRGHRAPVDGDDINNAVAGELYAKQLWPELTVALGEAVKGDASIFRAIGDSSYGRKRNGSYDPALDRYFMIGAAEQQYGTDPQPFIDAFDENRQRYPHFFFNNEDAELPYVFFDARDEDAYTGPFGYRTKGADALVIGTTTDPATPYTGALALTKQMGNARLLTMRGDGHTAYGGNSACIDRAVDRYVIGLKLPAKGTKCRQTVPFPPPPEPEASAASVGAAGVLRSAPSTPLTAPFG